MDIFNKSLEIWKLFDVSSTKNFEKKIIINEEFVGRNNNCLSTTTLSIILLNSKLNELHFVKRRDEDISHCTLLMTPQPINQYSQIEISSSKQFIALIGSDTVGIIDISSFSILKTCKKVTEVFKTQDEVLSVKWYPEMNDCLVILTKQSINIFQCRSDKRIVPCYQFYLQKGACVLSNSFGIKEEFITFDFGSSERGTDDNKLLILRDSGDILLLPELRTLITDTDILPKKLLFFPKSEDNYQDDFTSFVVLRGSIDILVLVNSFGTSQHALLIKENIYVYESINVSVINENVVFGPFIIPDHYSSPPRYLLLHSNGIHSCVLPWVIRLRLAVQGICEDSISTTFNTAGCSVIDYLVDTAPLGHIKQAPNKIHGVIILREALNSPELCVFSYGNDKRLIRVKLRQESTLMSVDYSSPSKESNISVHMWPSSSDQGNSFINAITSKLRKGGNLPCVAAAFSDKDDECDLKLALVLKISEKFTGDFSSRMDAAGQIFDQRMVQMKCIIELQQDQVNEIMTATKRLQEKAKKLAERFHKASSKQKNLFKRLSICSNKFASINNTIPRSDRESFSKIKNVEKRLLSMQSLLRSCKFKFEQSESYMDNVTLKTEISDTVIDVDTEKAQIFLMREDEDIKSLVEDVRRLMN